MCMKKYGRCPKFGRGDNLTDTLKYVLYGELSLLQAQLLLNGSLDLNETLHSFFLDITPYPFIFHRYLANIPVFQSLNITVLQAGGITQ